MRTYSFILALLFLNLPTVSIGQEFLRWSDEFNGTELDTNNWQYQLGDGCPDLCGWGNGESQFYLKSAVVVEQGVLKIEARKEKIVNSNYSSGRIRSINKFDFASGRVEVRARFPIGRGYWPAVWFLPTQNYFGTWPLSGEIDLIEGKGQEPRNTYGTIHYGAHTPNNKYTGATYTHPTDSFTSGFHTFSLLWSKDTLQWLVDGVVFSTKTKANLPDFWWPYDHNYHALINLAVGGNFLGYPDASTPDTATFQIDYIRVYQNLNQIFITGPNALLRLDQQKEYYTQNLSGATYNWQVPASAKIISGQGTPKIKVNWGLHSDSIHVNITHLGVTRKISKWVLALPDTCEGMIDNIDNLRTVYWVGGSGNYKAAITNPVKDAINNSNFVNRYYRSGSTPYDALLLHTDVIHEAKDFEDGKVLLKMKLYTTAPVGTEVNINFENRKLAGANYPSGRRCVLQAKTSKSREWEELTFKLILKPDPATPQASIDQLVILFAPNSSSSDVFYFDDFGVKETPCKELSIGLSENQLRASKTVVYPNPFADHLQIDNELRNGLFSLYDMSGKLLIPEGHIEALNVGLPKLGAGTYFLIIKDGEHSQSIKLIKTTH